MKFALLFPMRAVKHYHQWMNGGDLGIAACIAEDAGFDAIGMSEHPYPDDAWLGKGGHHAFDPFVSLGFMAASTEKIRMLTYVMVSSYRHPYMAAKAAASLDVLSKGRLTLGMAAGYLADEFVVLGADYTSRGRLLDAAIPAMRSAWAGTDHDSDLFPAHGNTMLPQPMQSDGPPIWIGGNSGPARRRAVEHGQGWIPMGQSAETSKITKSPPLESIGELAVLISSVQKQRAELGKPPLDVVFTPFEAEMLRTHDVEACAAAVAEVIPAYEDAGVTWIGFEPSSRTLDAYRRDIGVLGERVVTRFS